MAVDIIVLVSFPKKGVGIAFRKQSYVNYKKIAIAIN